MGEAGKATYPRWSVPQAVPQPLQSPYFPSTLLCRRTLVRWAKPTLWEGCTPAFPTVCSRCFCSYPQHGHCKLKRKAVYHEILELPKDLPSQSRTG